MKKGIEIKYEYAPDYKILPATGAWGGLSPNGEVVVNFFVEFRTKPDSITLQIDEQGVLKEEEKEEELTLTRDLLVGIVMRPDIAKSVAEFILRNVKIAEEAHSDTNKGL